VFDEASGEFQLRATYGMSQELIASFELHHVAFRSACAGNWATHPRAERRPAQ
jgi:hypothetical protein